MRRQWSIAFVATLTVGCENDPRSNPSLCELAEYRSDYAGRTVSVEGNILSSAHGTVLIEPRCGSGIGIDWESDGTKQFAALNEAADLWDLGPAYVRVAVSGMVRRARTPGMSGKREWVLEIESARVLKAYRISNADNDRFYRWLDGPNTEPFKPSAEDPGTPDPVPVGPSKQ